VTTNGGREFPACRGIIRRLCNGCQLRRAATLSTGLTIRWSRAAKSCIGVGLFVSVLPDIIDRRITGRARPRHCSAWSAGTLQRFMSVRAVLRRSCKLQSAVPLSLCSCARNFEKPSIAVLPPSLRTRICRVQRPVAAGDLGPLDIGCLLAPGAGQRDEPHQAMKPSPCSVAAHTARSSSSFRTRWEARALVEVLACRGRSAMRSYRSSRRTSSARRLGRQAGDRS
jgi:hypothetical protein